MASLKSILQAGRIYSDIPEESGAFYELWWSVNRQIALLESRSTILVNGQGVWRDLSPWTPEGDLLPMDECNLRLLEYPRIPRPLPPYRHMWVEAINHLRQRFAVMVNRVDIRARLDLVGKASARKTLVLGETYDEAVRLYVPDELYDRLIEDRPAWVVEAPVWCEYEGSATPMGTVYYWLAADGQFLSSGRATLRNPDHADDEYRANQALMKVIQGWMLNVLARMNCANVTLVAEPQQETHSRRGRDRERVPSSVWHTIQVTSVPKLRDAATPQTTAVEVRFHWVRGHYADYTKGAGLFGNPKLKAVFWIPEHCAGTPELGTVVSDYAVQ